MYFVYLLKCSDASFYCGYTNDISKRITEHNSTKKGASYTKGRRPVTLVYSECLSDLSSALKREYEIKKLTRRQKEALVLSSKNLS